MIGSLKGKLVQKRPPFLLVEAGGVGYELEAPMTVFYDLPAADAEISLYTHMVVRDDAQLLFGFSELAQRDLFRKLLKISGVGPRVALAVLSAQTAAQFIACIQQQDADALSRVPGIGKKTAQRMLIDLRDRIDGIATPPQEHGSHINDAINALLSLGYKIADANKAVRAVAEKSKHREDLIRNALQYLSNR